MAEHLKIPFEARKVLRTRNPRDRDVADEFWRLSQYHVQFDSDSSFPAIVIREKLTHLRKDDTSINARYDTLKRTIDGST